MGDRKVGIELYVGKDKITGFDGLYIGKGDFRMSSTVYLRGCDNVRTFESLLTELVNITSSGDHPKMSYKIKMNLGAEE